MSDTDLEDLLKTLRKINDVTRSNIDLLTGFLSKKESNASSASKFLDDLSPSIVSLTQGIDEVKVKFKELSSGNPKCSKENSRVPVPLEEDSVQHNIQSECGDLVDEVSNCPIEESIPGDVQKTATIDVSEKSGEKCSPIKERLEGNEVKGNTEKCEKILNGSSEKTVNKNVEEPPVEDGNQDNIEVTEDLPADNTHDSTDEINENIETKPMLKIIDFNKLVDPRNLELMNKNESRKNARKASIIILSSSEDEPLITSKKDNPKKQSSVSHVQQSVKVVNPKKNNNSASKNIPSNVKDFIPSHIKDIKFRSNPYVRLIRITPEKVKQYYSRFKKNMESSDESVDESVSTRSKRRNCRKDTMKTRSKPVDERKKQLLTSSDSETSDDEISNSKRHNKADPKQDSSKGKKLSSSDMKKSDASKDDKEISIPCEELEKDKISDSKSESDSETFLNLKKKASNNEKEKSQSSDEKVDISSSDDEQNSQKEKKESDKEYRISSDDSDVDTFFRKNKFVKKKKKLVGSSESDGENSMNSESENTKKNANSASDNCSDKEDEDVTKKKRKRIRTEDNSSDSDDLTTRKKIKRLISKDSLSEQTKKAAAEERERKQRILEKQKKYNQIYEGMEIASSKVDKLVLDLDEKTGEPLLEVDKKLVEKLKPHQASGIQFMWDACFESLQRIKKSAGSGCILAHCMGLGKTLQVIALTNTLLESDDTNVKKVLIVTPLSTVLNWKAEFKNWLSGEESYDVYEMVSIRSSNADRASCLKAWHEAGGVMIISYAMFRNLGNDKNKKVSKKFRTIFLESLVDPGPDLVVCDEGHLLKNEKTNLSQAMSKIKTCRRIVLTGTPLQNNLKEYYCMVQFVKPNLLGTYKEYMNRFVNPITNGQYTDSTQYDINIMRRRSHVLHKLLDGIVQRRDYSVLSPYLPPKHEYVLFLTLTDVQIQLYKHYMEHFAKAKVDETSNKTSYLFKDFQAFTRICIHPRVLLDKSIDDQQKYQSDEESIGSLKDFIDDNQSTSSSDSSDNDSDSSSNKNKKVKRVTRANPKVTTDSDSEEDIADKKEWWQEYCDGEELDNIAHSTKLMLLFEILKECEQIGDKVLVFSQSLYALNLIEYFLEKIDEATQNGDADKKTCGFTGSWSPGLDYFRLDGSTNCGLRNEWCDSFNKDNSRARLFLLSTRAGGLGINLVAANRVILFDVSWNPSSDVQSIYRVYRFGQLKPSYIYRFVTYGTMEMKIYERQVTKQAISKRVIDEQQIDRHYNQNDLAALYNFEAPDRKDRPIPMVPKDILLGEMLQNHDDKIFKYHEHQSLLENKVDETLNEEERKAAWDEFENEKVERTKQVLIGSFTIPTVQLAMRNIIQRDNPTWNNNQILSIIPQLIQQLNMQMAAGDQTMYMRIAEEVKAMQVNYAKKMQMHYLQYQLQHRPLQTYPNSYPNPLMNPTAQGFAIPGVSGYNNPMRINPLAMNLNPNVVGNKNSNEVVELN